MRQFLGRRTKADIVSAYGVTIIPANSIIDSEALDLMVKHRVNEETVLVELTEAEEAVAASAEPSASVAANAQIEQSVQQLKEMFESVRVSRKVPIWDIRSEILPAVLVATDAPDIYKLLEQIKGKDDYTYEHNIGVAVLASLIGRWMNLNDAELSMLSFAAILHDIGKMRLPEELLMKPGRLTADEHKLIQKHAVYGYEMLRDTKGIHHRVALVALQHHEREDGGGYPFGLTKERIDPLSSIVAVADVFHAMSSKRPHRDAYPFHLLIREMTQEKFGKLNPQIVSLFVDNLCRHLVGQKVKLTDGRASATIPRCAGCSGSSINRRWPLCSSIRGVSYRT